MANQNRLIIKEDVLELRKLLKQQNTLTGEKRVKCLIYIKEMRFSTRIQLAQHLCIHKRTLERWLKKYSTSGLRSMVMNQSKPKQSKYITENIHKGLESKVTNSGSPFLGYWDAQQWLKKEYGVDINYHTLRHYLIKHFGTKLKSPRKSHIKKDEQAIEAFLKTS